MHILKIIHGYPPNYNAGSEVYSQSVSNELSRYNIVSVFTREENPYAPDFNIRHEKHGEKLYLYFVNNPQGRDGYRHEQMDKNFARLLSEINPEVAHIGHLNHLSTGLVDVLCEKRIPVVFTLHDFWLMCPRGQFLTRGVGMENNFQMCTGQDDHKCASTCYRVYFSGHAVDLEYDEESWSRWVSRRMTETRSMIDKVNLFIAPSNYLRNKFINEFGVPEDKIIYLDYGFPTEYLTPTEKATGKRPYTFGYIGTHIPAKGVNQLIEAFGQISEPAVLRIFGRDNGQSTESLRTMASRCTNKVEFAGEYVNSNLADQVFSSVDCIVVPSIWGENSPLVIHEAQACKVPVITADFGGMSEYVKHRFNGLLFEHRNANSLAEQMQYALSNPQELKEYGKRGYLYSKDGSVPSIQDHCKELSSIYARVINGGKLWRITIDTNPEDCNLKCVMCEEHSPYSDFIPNLYKTTGVKRRRMKFHTVEAIFRQAEKLGVREIIPSTMGEPLLYKGIEGIFELSKKHNIKINLTTNGTFPKLSVAEWARIIVPNTSDIKISWNGATAETARQVMLGLDFEKAVNNVREFISVRDKHFRQTGYYCRVTFQLTFMRNNMHELADIVRLAASLGVDRVKGHQLWAHFDEIKPLSMKDSPESRSEWNKYVKEAYTAQENFHKPDGNKVILENVMPLNDGDNEALPENYECPFLNRELWVSATGTISPCCAPDNLRKSLGDFGNIESTTLEAVLNSPTYQNLVKNYKQTPLCKTCNMRKPI